MHTKLHRVAMVILLLWKLLMPRQSQIYQDCNGNSHRLKTRTALIITMSLPVNEYNYRYTCSILYLLVG